MANYSDKLKSPKWQKKRLEILKRDEFTCKVCDNKDKMLHVHHVYEDYEINPWEHDSDTLITLCEDCHATWHKIFKIESDPYTIVQIAKTWLDVENKIISKAINNMNEKPKILNANYF